MFLLSKSVSDISEHLSQCSCFKILSLFTIIAFFSSVRPQNKNAVSFVSISFRFLSISFLSIMISYCYWLLLLGYRKPIGIFSDTCRVGTSYCYLWCFTVITMSKIYGDKDIYLVKCHRLLYAVLADLYTQLSFFVE